MKKIQTLPNELGSVEDVIKRFKKAKELKDSGWREHMRECYQYALPQRETFNLYHPGQKKNIDLYDDTAVEGVTQFASQLQARLMPPWRQWTKLVPGSDFGDEDQEQIQEALDDATETMFSYIDHSNLSLQVTESFQDLAVSTGVLSIDEGDGDNLLVFGALPLAEVYAEEGPNGTIDTLWRQHKVKIRNALRKWPEAKWSEQTNRKATEKPDDDLEVIEGVIFEPKAKLFYYAVLERTDENIESNAGHLAYAEEDETARWIAFRENVVPGETYGRGRIMRLLPTIKTANKLVELILRNASLSVSGIYTAVTDNIINPYNLVIAPGVIPVGSNDRNNPSIRALERSADFNVGDLVLNDLRENIRKVLMADPLGSVEEAPVKSATEVAIRNQRHLFMAGASSGRLQTELVERLIARVVAILKKNGKMPDIRVDGRDVTLKHMSPIARAQDDDDLLQFSRGFEAMAPLGMPAIAGQIAIEKIPGWIAKKAGYPAELIRDDVDEQQLMEMTAKFLAQMQMEQQQGGGQ